MTHSSTGVRGFLPARAAWTISGLIFLALIIPAGSWFGELSHGVQALLLFAGVAALIAGLGAERPAPSILDRPVSRSEILAVGAVTIAALAARLIVLETSIRFLIDEGNSIRDLQVSAESGTGLLDPPSVYVTTMLYPYGNALAAAAIGPTLTGLRFFSAILGAATIPAVYAFARLLFDRSTALSAAILLASFPPHLHFSRLALPHVMDALFGTIAMAAIAGGLIDNRRRPWAIAGAALGLTHYGFEAGRWFFTPLAILWLGYLACTGTLIRDRLRGVAIFAIAFTAAVLPVYVAALLRGSPISPRLRSGVAAIGEAGFTEIMHRMVAAFAVYLRQPDTSNFYFGDTALILTPLLPLFAIGLAVLLYPPARLRSVAMAVPLWLGAAAFGNAAMRESASYARWVVACPAVAVALAVGLYACLRRLSRRAGMATIATAFIIAAFQLGYYFGPHLRRVNEDWRAVKHDRDAFDGVLLAAEKLPPRTDLYFVSDPLIDVHPPRELLSFVAADAAMTLGTLTPAELPEAVAALPIKRGAAFFIAEGDTSSASLLAALPRVRGPLRSNHPLPPGERFELYFLPP